MEHQVRVKIGAEELVLESGKIAKQANGAVFGRYGGSAVIATICASEQDREGLDFIPLSVEYNEKYYAAGKIPGGFIKREGRPKDREILVSRLIDRPMRPLFSKKFKRELQIIPTVVSTDQINPPDVLAMVAASAAVTISDIPFDGPVGAVRLGYADGEFIVNPTYDQIERCEMEIVVAGTDQGITMVEGSAREVSEEVMVRAIEEAHKAIKEICRAQLELVRVLGKEKLPLPEVESGIDEALREEIVAWARPQMETACFVEGKHNRSKAIKAIGKAVAEEFADRVPEEFQKQIGAILEDLEAEVVRTSILGRKVRTDGRGPEDIRPISCEVDFLSRTHGSALFTRGETQALVVTTLGTVFDEQIMDDIEGDSRKAFMLHYNFPPYSVGETGRLGAGRREIGHGNLAERSLKAVMPGKENFPYTIRVVSEVLESNGSSSMATVCGCTLSLLNAGVPISKSVAGIAMGLVSDGNDYVVLSDILGEEDHLGDMDFKVAGTADGITGFQMDIKIGGVDYEILGRALEQARRGRLHILQIMGSTIKEPRDAISDYAPKIISIKIDPDKIGAVIGPGGKMIKGMTERTGATINVDNDGTVTIYSREKEKAEEAQNLIQELVAEPEVGRWYNGTVRRIMDFGAFIEFLPGKEGLCHVSRLSEGHVNDVRDVLTEGQEVKVKLFEIDRMGRMNLSMIENPEPRRSSGPGGDSGGPRRYDGDRPRSGGPRDGGRSSEDRGFGRDRRPERRSGGGDRPRGPNRSDDSHPRR
ncbi:MAG: polyribonucleotide nucleotidyltransferase [Spirochaetales bacterium]|nr:polyribonucleotide nucleotidyltransferase [Spirochaetales bacterium]